ncbi:MAG TPA: hypothetical protein ENK47_06245 [Euryarchaeota archaeon]|nr:MAG: hypothetical protein B6U90_06330 [Thermoplasmatales archaeon ex4484_6]RLF65560.1 MAG: hypothetical protein DRN57_08865 [Thermoplasmata archaeon]HHD16293.1 hypothetical protein [Euryarchaeota archaeon]
MARRMKYRGSGKKRNFGPKKRNPGEKLRKPMLALGRLDYFKYDLKEIIERSDIEEDLRPSFMASVTAKARQRSISDAKEYIEEMMEKGEVSEETSRKLFNLLDRYTKVR